MLYNMHVQKSEMLKNSAKFTKGMTHVEKGGEYGGKKVEKAWPRACIIGDFGRRRHEFFYWGL